MTIPQQQRPPAELASETTPAAYGEGLPSPWYPSLHLPPPPRTSYLWPVLSALLVLSAVIAVGGGAATAWALRQNGRAPAAVAWVGVDAEAIDRVLQRRAQAVQRKDAAAWMADVDQSDPAFGKRQRQEFDNLAKLPFAQLEFERTPQSVVKMAAFLPSGAFEKYHAAVRIVPVTIRHRIEGVDSRPVATPWLAVFAYVGHRWVIAGDGAGKDLPTGEAGQPWDAAGPIAVVRNERVTAVISADAGPADGGQGLLELAMTGLQQVAAVKPGGWDGKVLLTAVADRRIFDTYFAESQDRVAQVAAIAVPYYSAVAEWSNRPAYATTRIVFNPSELSAARGELQHDLTHEFTHAAMGPVTGPYTPRWVVEGFAEYVAYKDGHFAAAGIRQALGDLAVTQFPDDKQFYEEPRNYVAGWLACRMIAERYTQDRLVAFYEAFQRLSEVDSAAREVLGVSRVQLEQQWREYVDVQRRG
ncbi:hypothetical protein Dvina_53120 [Dactylosporangium vinaceum]|uniref:Peptidase MA-like domain-containing protein n=1 Tax=Dactylosporangium vinaceum TaxID=53362 RepID=A0ABV5MQ52_9ACTN|nr:hypothetical protein [Dactylosporangium vinaceum]UAB96552.1 hypothetical protein Dvina_53120 [Dactylosporangium vinaceum]